MRLTVVDAGLMSYGEALALQEDTHGRRVRGEIPDTLVLLEHPPVITLGRRAGDSDVLIAPEAAQRLGVEVVRTGRGGEVTYHGPGQLVGYFMCGLEIAHRSVKRFVRQVEEALILALQRGWGVHAGRREGCVGVWVGAEKIAALGFSVSQRVTMHGFSLNVTTNLEHFGWIVPCGMRGGLVTSLKKILGREVLLDEVKREAVSALAEVFGWEISLRGGAVRG
jgi:lipoate-protein ligase B